MNRLFISISCKHYTNAALCCAFWTRAEAEMIPSKSKFVIVDLLDVNFNPETTLGINRSKRRKEFVNS